MANPMKPEATVLEVSGKTVAILFDLNAFAAIEDDYPSTEAAFKAMEDGSLKALRTVLAAAIQSGTPDGGWTKESVGALVHLKNMKQVTEALVEALTDAMPEGAQKAGGQGNVEKPPKE